MVLVFCTLGHGDIYLHNVSKKYIAQFSSYRVDKIYYRNHYFQNSKDHNSISKLPRVTVLVFCTLSHEALYLCEASLNYLERFSTYRTDTSI